MYPIFGFLGFLTYYDCFMSIFQAASFDVVVFDECLPSDGVHVFQVSAFVDGELSVGFFEFDAGADRWQVVVAAVECLKEMSSEVVQELLDV